MHAFCGRANSSHELVQEGSTAERTGNQAIHYSKRHVDNTFTPSNELINEAQKSWRLRAGSLQLRNVGRINVLLPRPAEGRRIDVAWTGAGVDKESERVYEVLG